MSYIPRPLDTSEILLRDDLGMLVELLAKNTHENWAQERMRHGWQWGPERNDQKKEHPCLVPYENLPEDEKDHDRIAAREVLKAIILMGFRIEKNGEP